MSSALKAALIDDLSVPLTGYLFPSNGGHHATLGASAAPRFMVCTASVGDISSENVRDDEDKAPSAASKEGTLAHAILEHCINEGISPLNLLLEDFTYEFSGNGGKKETETITLEDTKMLSRLDDLVVYLSIKLQGYEVEPEKKLPIDWLTLEEDATGEGDICAYNPDTGDVYIGDLKYGYVYVSPTSIQLTIYGLAYIRELLLAGKKVNSLTTEIYQPKHEKEDDIDDTSQYRQHTFTDLQELIDIAHSVRKTAVDIHEGNVSFVPTDKACMFCKLKHTCVARKNSFIEHITSGFDDVPEDEGDTLSEEFITWLVKNESKITKYVKDTIQSHSIMAEITGEIPEGLELVEQFATPVWSDPKKVETRLRGLKVPKKDYTDTKILTVAALKSVVDSEVLEKLEKFILRKPKQSLLKVAKKVKETGDNDNELM